MKSRLHRRYCLHLWLRRHRWLIIWLLLSVVLSGGGCEYSRVNGEETREAVILRSVSALPDEIKASINATGSTEAWLKVAKLEARCVATFYKPTGSYYLTEQVHEISPVDGSMRILAEEPQGQFVWELSSAGFKVEQGKQHISDLPIKLCDQNLARTILDMITAPVRLAPLLPSEEGTGAEGESIKLGQAIKVEGQWYYPIEPVNPSRPVAGLPSRIFYQNKDSFLLDVIRLVDTERGVFLTARGYNYELIKGAGIIVPTKIEIFKTNPQGAQGQKLVEFNYHTVRPIGLKD